MIVKVLPERGSRGTLLVLAVCAVAAAFVLNLVRMPWDTGAVWLPGRVGETRDLVRHPRHPLRWRSDDVIEFRTWRGIETIRVDGTGHTVRAIPVSPEGLASPSPPGIRLSSDKRLGRWKPWAGGWYLIDGDEKCGPPLVPSPNGTYLACTHVINDRWNETNEAFGAVIVSE